MEMGPYGNIVRELERYGTFFDELWLTMSSYLVKREAYLVPLRRRHRLQLCMVSPEFYYESASYRAKADG